MSKPKCHRCGGPADSVLETPAICTACYLLVLAEQEHLDRMRDAAKEMFGLLEETLEAVGAKLCGCVVLAPHERKCRWCRTRALITKIEEEKS